MSDIEDEISRLMAQGSLNNTAPTGVPTQGTPGTSSPAPNLSQPTVQQSSGPRRSRQAAMMNMVQAGQVQAGTPTVQTQTDSYQPTVQSQPTPQPAVNNVQQSTTIINNTTQQSVGSLNDLQADNDEGNKFKGKALIFGGIGLVVILLLVFILPKFGGSDNEEPEVTPDPMEDLDWVIPEVELFQYTPEQVSELRRVGYTGDEIEQFQYSEMDYEGLIAEAEAARQAWIDEAVAPLYDLASDEYKEYIADSWLSLPERTDMSDYINTVITQERKNLDYEKIKVYGNQLFVKIYLDDSIHEDWFFIQVTPEEWNKLNDFGNIIVSYTYCNKAVYNEEFYTYDADRSSFYILDASIEFIE